MTRDQPTTATADPDSDPISVLLVDDDEDFVTLASTLLEAESDRIETVTQTSPQTALETVDISTVDCVVSDYRMPEMDGIEFLETIRADYPELPCILFTGKGDEEVAKRAIAADVNDYIVKDGSADQYAISANRIENLVEQYRIEQRARHKQALDTLSQAVLQSVLHEPTREGIERNVCEQLAGSDRYSFAWIGERDSHTGKLEPRAWAGEGTLLEAVTFSAADEPRTVEELALADGDQRVETGLSNADSEWAGHAAEQGFDAAVGLPISYEDIPYGVLGVYTEHAIDADEAAVLATLADLTAFAIGAIERRRGDTSQQVVEIELDVTTTAFPFVHIADTLGCSVDLVQTTRRTDGTGLTLYRLGAEPDGVDGLAGTLDAESVSLVDDGRELSVVSATPWWEDLTGLYGAKIGDATADSDSARLRLELPPSAEVRSVVDHIEAGYPNIEPVARRERTRTEQSVTEYGPLGEELTDRQQEVLETAYHAGYYEWPHAASSEEVAELLGIAQPTFAEHFWTAQRQIAERLFDDEDGSE